MIGLWLIGDWKIYAAIYKWKCIDIISKLCLYEVHFRYDISHSWCIIFHCVNIKFNMRKKKSVIVLLINIRNAIDIFLKERKNGMNILRAEIIEKAVLIIFQSFICLGEWIISTIVTFSIILLIMRYKCFYRFLWYLFDFVSISIDEKNFQTFGIFQVI